LNISASQALKSNLLEAKYDSGTLYTCIGHDGLWYWKNKLAVNGSVNKEEIKEYYYDATGTAITTACGGIALSDNNILVGVGGGIYIY
jgi:hypothetical protein